VRCQVGAALAAGLTGMALGVALLVGPAVAPAQAETYCAPGPCSEGTEVATIAEAVEMADSNAGPDTVAIQPGTYNTPMEACGGLFVTKPDTHVRGAGIGQTTLTFPPLEPTDGFTRSVICGFMHLSDLTLRLPSAITPGHNSSVQGIDLYGGLVERIRVDAVGATFGPSINDGRAEAMLLRRGVTREVEVDFDPTEDTEGIATGYLTELRDVTVRAKQGGLHSRVNQEPGLPPMRVSRVSLHTDQPLTVLNESGVDGRMELSDALLDASGTPPGEASTGVTVVNGLPPKAAELALDRATIVGNGAPESTAMQVSGQGEPKPTVLEARHVVATGFERTLRIGLFGAGGVVATIDYSNLDLSPAAIFQEGTEGTATTAFGPGNRAGNPLFVAPAAGDFRLADGSPAIDIGGADLVAGGPVDLGGSPRPTDGDGDGIVLPDAGAFEHPTEPVIATPAPDGKVKADRKVKVIILGRRLSLNRRGIARLKLRCPVNEQSPPCQGALLLRTKAKLKLGQKRRRLVLARGKFRIGAGRTVRVKLRFSRRKAALVRGKPRARKVLAIARVHDSVGNHEVNRKGLKIVPVKKRRR
jgi:hypothetical protein